MAGSVPFVRRVLLCVIVVTALAACGDNAISSPGAAPASAATSAAAAVQGTGTVAKSLLLSAPRVGGGTVNLADYAGKPVALWFWAPT
jgi:hypothetical protein